MHKYFLLYNYYILNRLDFTQRYSVLLLKSENCIYLYYYCLNVDVLTAAIAWKPIDNYCTLLEKAINKSIFRVL